MATTAAPSHVARGVNCYSMYGFMVINGFRRVRDFPRQRDASIGQRAAPLSATGHPQFSMVAPGGESCLVVNNVMTCAMIRFSIAILRCSAFARNMASRLRKEIFHPTHTQAPRKRRHRVEIRYAPNPSRPHRDQDTRFTHDVCRAGHSFAGHDVAAHRPSYSHPSLQ